VQSGLSLRNREEQGSRCFLKCGSNEGERGGAAFTDEDSRAESLISEGGGGRALRGKMPRVEKLEKEGKVSHFPKVGKTINP